MHGALPLGRVGRDPLKRAHRFLHLAEAKEQLARQLLLSRVDQFVPPHEGRPERVLAAPVALEDVARKAAIARLRHAQDKWADTRGQLALPISIAVALPFFRTFVAVGAEVIAHLRLEHLVEDRLDQLAQRSRLLE